MMNKCTRETSDTCEHFLLISKLIWKKKIAERNNGRMIQEGWYLKIILYSFSSFPRNTDSGEKFTTMHRILKRFHYFLLTIRITRKLDLCPPRSPWLKNLKCCVEETTTIWCNNMVNQYLTYEEKQFLNNWIFYKSIITEVCMKFVNCRE